MNKVASKVSVIIPCYNEGKLLLETIKSVEKQTYNNIEIILCNDCSDHEETNKICEQLSESKRVNYIKLNNHRWTAGARNEAIKHSTGDLIFPLDEDDLLHETFLEKVVYHLQTNENIDFVYTDMVLFYEGGKQEVYEKPDFERGRVIAQGYPGSAILYRKSDYDRTRGYSEDLKGQEDWEYLIQLCGLGLTGGHLAEPLYYYRQKGKNASKHMISMKNYGLESKNIIVKKNADTFKKYSTEVILGIYAMHHELWLGHYRSLSPKYHVKWLLIWLYRKFFKKK